MFKLANIYLYDYLVEHDHVKLQELTEVTGKSYPTVKRYMQILKDAAIKRREKYENTLKKVEILKSIDPY